MKLRSDAVASLRMLLVMTLICGGLYPAAVTLLARLFFPHQAGGSLLRVEGQVSASRLLAYRDDDPVDFHFRPSACGWNTMPGTASNLAPSSGAWHDSLRVRRSRFLRENRLADTTRVPAEMLCSSGSGLDPDISPAAAHLQVMRIVMCRGGGPEETQQLHLLIDSATRQNSATLWGAPIVNVSELNYRLNKTYGFITLQKATP
ncbi:MAG TPA: potassium-transporting ATPase subunit C [bacterium]|nr:potassium-transporting ATPase subunit C [bacterium]HQG45111.1 potassium-transporting ATPase subunit C [bacterium]HQI47354.1 potassium-transporting ATPase subunit C [bacterium]HQJ63044.1 potassium-transporting ATPase subunit C [bacterium]